MRIYLGILIIILVLIVLLVQWNQPTQTPQADPEETFEDKETITVQPPFAITPINEVDDYEYNLVFANEGEKAITKANRDLLMSAYPMDWSTQPPSSATFQEGMAEFQSDLFHKQQTPQLGSNPYARIEGFAIPPGTEKEILSTYVPKKPQELTTYDAEDAKEINDRIYSARGQIADMKPSTTDSNVFIITGVRNKANPISYEPDAEATTDASPASKENTIVAPVIYTSEQQGLDPFFTPGDSTRDGKWDYTRFTPGLERSFAPNQPMQNWY